MRSRSVSLQSERSYSMHHRKQKSASSSSTGATAKGSQRNNNGHDVMARFRYLNKNPLCLQYNGLNSNCAKRNNKYRTKKKEQSFIIVLVLGLYRLVYWLVIIMKKEFWNFIFTPADQLHKDNRPVLIESSNEKNIMRKSSISKKYVNGIYKRDYARTNRILALQDKRSQLCYFS